MMLTYHISHEKIFSTALYVHGRSGVKRYFIGDHIYIKLKLLKFSFHSEFLCQKLLIFKNVASVNKSHYEV